MYTHLHYVLYNAWYMLIKNLDTMEVIIVIIRAVVYLATCAYAHVQYYCLFKNGGFIYNYFTNYSIRMFMYIASKIGCH